MEKRSRLLEMMVSMVGIALGLGLGTALHYDSGQDFATWFRHSPTLYSLLFLSNFLLGVTTVEFFGVTVEMIRSKSSIHLRRGRWIWFVFGGALITEFLWKLVHDAIPEVTTIAEEFPSVDWLLFELACTPYIVLSYIKFVPLVVWIACVLARIPNTSKYDAKEWSARVLAIALPLCMITLRFLPIR